MDEDDVVVGRACVTAMLFGSRRRGAWTAAFAFSVLTTGPVGSLRSFRYTGGQLP